MIRRIYSVVSCCLFVLIVGIAFLLHHPAYGYSVHVVLSGSMEPAVPEGSIVISKMVSPAAYKPGDVITFMLLDQEHTQVTHRIIRRFRLSTGIDAVETKGDANANGDAWQVTLGQVSGKMIGYVPLIGYLCEWEKTFVGFLLVVGLTFLFLVTPEFYRLLQFLQERLAWMMPVE